MFAPGDKFDRYVIAGLLGKGGMGEVYRAHDTRLQRTVALKIVREADFDESQAGSRGGARVLREARSVAALSHPNVISIFDVGAAEGVWFLAMELVNGRSLRAYVGDRATMLEEKRRWAIEIARALAAAHQRGLVHRDLKPENVMVADDGVVKVLDFGIARRVSAPVDPSASTRSSIETLTGKGMVVGTPRYMAPEQLQGAPVTGRTDVFAWGVVVYELFSGAMPWSANEGVALVSDILTATPKPLRERVEAVSADMDAIVRRALAKGPNDRPTSDEILAALGGDTSPRRTSIPARVEVAGSGSTRMQLAASVAPAVSARRAWRMLAVLGALAATIVGAWQWNRARTPTLAPPSPPPAVSVAIVEATSTNAEAAASYRLAQQLLRDATTDGAILELDSARKLDPLFAAAHLRRATAAAWMDGPAREAYERAVQLREQLNERDRVLLDANEPWSRFEPDANERVRRLAAAQARWPDDMEIALQLCRAGVAATSEATATSADTACARALALDGSSAEAWHEKALALALRGDAAGAFTAYATCLAKAATSSDCLRELIQLRSNDGACDDALQLSRRLVAARPTMWSTYERLASMLAGAGEATESIDVALARTWERAPDDVKAREMPRVRAMLAEMGGRFAEASRALDDWSAVVESSTVEMDHLAVARARWELAIETGKLDSASRLALEFTKKHVAWTVDPRFAPIIMADGVRHRTGASTPEQWIAARTTWIAHEKQRVLDSLLLGVGAIDRWRLAYVEPIVTASDARDAIAAMPPLTAPGALREDASWDGAIGAMDLIAGRASDAAPLLARASASCDPLADPLAQTRAIARLGAARESLGDKDAACRAYALVLSRWGAAKPPSVTAEDARARAKRLGCPP